MKFYASLSLALCSPAFGVTVGPMAKGNCLTQNISYRPAIEGLRDLKMSTDLVATTAKIEIPGPDGKKSDICNLIYTSDEGTALTDGHCTFECLNQKRVFRRKSPGIYVVDKELMNEVTCKMQINGVEREVQVLATNDCPLHATYYNGNECPNVDYALIKIKGGLGDKDKCATVPRNASGQPPTKVASVQYTGKPTSRSTFQRNAMEGRGTAVDVTHGEVIPPQENCETQDDLQRGQSRTLNFPKSDDVRAIMNLARTGRLLQTTVDMTNGSSGSGLFATETSDLVGLSSLFLRWNPEGGEMHGFTHECRGATFFTPIGEILKDIKTNYPNLRLDEVLRCDSRRISGAAPNAI